MKRKIRRFGEFPWNNKWYVKQNRKEHKYFCDNCYNTFRTGKFSRFDSNMYDDVCPNCGALGITFEELVREFRILASEYNSLYDKEDK